MSRRKEFVPRRTGSGAIVRARRRAARWIARRKARQPRRSTWPAIPGGRNVAQTVLKQRLGYGLRDFSSAQCVKRNPGARRGCSTCLRSIVAAAMEIAIEPTREKLLRTEVGEERRLRRRKCVQRDADRFRRLHRPAFMQIHRRKAKDGSTRGEEVRLVSVA